MSDSPTNPPRFETRDPARAEFWSERYARAFTPWDQQGVPPDLAAELNRAGPGAGRLPALPAHVLLPGCGNGYELRVLADAGYDAIAIDIAQEAVVRAQAQAGAHGARVRLADCFALADDPGQRAHYGWVYERAFLCALPPRLWPRWAQAMRALVAPGGVLAGFFHFDPAQDALPREARRGPPFALAASELAELLGDAFVCETDRAVASTDSVPVFRDRERWMVWRRTA